MIQSSPTEVRPGVYNYWAPEAFPAPCIFDVPRSGREYPPGFFTTLPFNTVHFLVSHYVEELWSLAPKSGSGLLYALFVNNYIDANRSEFDIEADLLAEPWPGPLKPTSMSTVTGMGLIHSRARGSMLRSEKLAVAEVQHRIGRYWRPYHDRLAQLIAERRNFAKAAFHLSCHCMGTYGPPTAHDSGKKRADFCLGDYYGATSSRDFVDVVAQILRARGFTVSLNDPFAGAECVRRHGRPDAGVHSVQIEVIKGLFMEEESFRKKPCFNEVQDALGVAAAEIAGYARSYA